MSAPAQEPDNGPLNYAPKSARHAGRDQDPAGAPRRMDPAPHGGAPEPPWKRSKQPDAFAGDVAIAELRSRLALAPDRLQEPPRPVSPRPKLGLAGRLAGVAVVAAVGVMGYRWGAAPPAPAPLASNASSRGDLALERPNSRGPGSTSVGNSRVAPVRSATGSANDAAVDDGSRGASRATPADGPTAAELAFASPAAAKGIAPQMNEQRSLDRSPSRAPPAQLTINPTPTRPADEPAQPAMSAPDSGPGQSIARSQPRRLSANEIALMVRNGNDFMANGNIGAARMIFQPAAEAGDPVAAFALAETYDPLVLRKLNAKGGITADVALAQAWYRRARDLGSAVAPERLERLARLPE